MEIVENRNGYKLIKKEETAIVADKPMKMSRMIKKEQNIKLSVNEVIDMLGGYQMSDHSIIVTKENSGKCLLCGKITNAEMRKICYDCHKKHIKPIYEQMKTAISNGKYEIEYKY